MIVENASFHFFWVILRFSSYVGNCKNIFSLKVYSISSDFAWSFLNIKYFTNKVEKEFHVFKHSILKIFHKNLSNIFPKLPAATNLNPEPMGFLIEVNFGKVPKLLIGCRKLRKLGNSDAFVVNSRNFIVLSFPNCVLNTLLFQRSGKWNFYSTKFSCFEQKFGMICQKTCFLSFVGFWGVFEANYRIIAVISSKMPTGCRDSSLLSSLNLFMQGSSSKIVQNCA